MLSEALKRRASDIHVEPQENNLRVRFRIDGDLVDAFTIPKKNENALTARIKIISGMDITEARLPQDGRFKIKFLNKEVDFRVSLLPTSFGQTLVLRVLDRSALLVGLESLGFSPESLVLLKEAIAKPYGMLLVTGPTGSGKSTTLYSVLNLLNTPERNIVTVEDPVEYQIEGITQIPVKSDIGMNFAVGLRSILRQSPDVILIGEIRDSETADIAIKASLTGQFVMATLHTNNACQAITRLIDMGLEPFLVASSLIMSSAQRLMRVICARCKKEDNPPEVLLKSLNIRPGIQFFKGAGCSFCAHTGYYGRQAILEILMIDDIIREMVVKGAAREEMQEYAVRHCKMKTLRQEAIARMEKGLTTVEEVVRITAEQ
jgi:type II secretory ATPase GspE/PulE/Tfp pilus assembly ATPase PilB-like protein